MKKVSPEEWANQIVDRMANGGFMNEFSEEDADVFSKLIAGSAASVAVMIAMAPTAAMMAFFIAGMSWRGFKDDMESPLQDMLRDVNLE